MKELGSNIKALRKIHKISQKELANRLNVSQTSVAHYEKGTRAPSIETLISLSKLFEVSIDELVDNVEHESEQKYFPDKDTITEHMYELLIDKKDLAFFNYMSDINEHYNIRTIIDEMLKTVLYRIGYEWEIGAITEVDEHYASHIVRRSIHLLSMKKPVGLKIKRAIALTVHSEQHTLGIEMVCAYLENNGIEALYLGRDIPIRSLNRLIRDYSPSYIFMSVTLREHIYNLVTMLNGIYALKGKIPTIAVGGQAIHLIGDELENYPEVILLDSVEQLKEMISE